MESLEEVLGTRCNDKSFKQIKQCQFEQMQQLEHTEDASWNFTDVQSSNQMTVTWG